MEHSVSFQVRDHQFIQLGLTSILGEGDDDGICSPLLAAFNFDYLLCRFSQVSQPNVSAATQICREYEIIARPLIVISECEMFPLPSGA